MAQMPVPLTEMPLNPTPQQAGIATRRVPKEIPDMDDPFCDPESGLKWAELVIEQPTPLGEQAVVDFTKPFWHYLGELSTEYISKYSDDPKRRIPNEAANLIPSRKPKPKRQQQPKAMFTANMQATNGYLGYTQGALQQQQQQQQRAFYNQQQSQNKQDQSYHAPVAPMMGQIPQQQLWPPIYRPSAPAAGGSAMHHGVSTQQQHGIPSVAPTAAAMQGICTTAAAAGQPAAQVIDQRRAEQVAAAALSVSMPFIDDVSPFNVHVLFDDAMEVLESTKQANGPSVHTVRENGINNKSATISPTQKAKPQPPVSTPKKASPKQITKTTADMVPVPTPSPVTPFQSNSNNPFSTLPATPVPPSSSQSQSKVPPKPKATPTKVVPLADIQAALARLAKAKAEAEARERLQAQAQAAQAQAAAAPPQQAA